MGRGPGVDGRGGMRPARRASLERADAAVAPGPRAGDADRDDDGGGQNQIGVVAGDERGRIPVDQYGRIIDAVK